MRRLIVNADDFGLTCGVNRAIYEAHTTGVVTSATLMAAGSAFDDGVASARSTPALAIGCHVALVDEVPVSDPEAIPTLIAAHPEVPPRFLSSPAAIAVRSVFGRFDEDELVREIVAQIQKIQAAGIVVTHLDTHKHLHIFPGILKAMVKAARICGVAAIRNPFVPITAMRLREFARRPGTWKRYGQVRMLRTLAGQFLDRVQRAGLSTPHGIVGVIETGSFDPALLRHALADLSEGTWELVCHPGYNDADLRAARTRLLESRDAERRWLASVEFREFLQHEGFRLISYREIE